VSNTEDGTIITSKHVGAL